VCGENRRLKVGNENSNLTNSFILVCVASEHNRKLQKWFVSGRLASKLSDFCEFLFTKMQCTRLHRLWPFLARGTNFRNSIFYPSTMHTGQKCGKMFGFIRFDGFLKFLGLKMQFNARWVEQKCVFQTFNRHFHHEGGFKSL
jgi:hypothetical protein